MSTQTHPTEVTDRELLEAVEKLHAAGVTDALDGGVPTVEIATELGIQRKSVANRVRSLVDQGVLKRVWGYGPDGARRSYLPAGDLELYERAKHGPTQSAILELLEHSGEMRSRDIASTLNKSESATSSALNRLKEKGLVESRNDPTERGQCHLFQLTETEV